MKKEFLFALVLFVFGYFGSCFYSFAQDKHKVDSLNSLLANPSAKDTTKAGIYELLGTLYYSKDIQKAINFTSIAIELYRKGNFSYGEAHALHWMGVYQSIQGANDKAIYAFLQSLRISERISNNELIGANMSRIADINRIQENYAKSFEMHTAAIDILRRTTNKLYLTNALHRMGLLLNDQEKHNEALFYFQEAYLLAKGLKNKNQMSLCASYIGHTYMLQNKNEEALPYLEQAESIGEQINNKITIARVRNWIGYIYSKQNDIQKSLTYSYKALKAAKEVDTQPEIRDICINLYRNYKKINEIDSALKYFEYSVALKDSLYSKEKDDLINLFQIEAQIENQKIELEKKENQIEKRNILIYSSFLFIVLILGIISILYASNKKQKKVNVLLNKQKEEAIQQQHQISEQNGNLQLLNEEIIQQKEEIEALNNHLEELVETRTKELGIAVDNLLSQNQDLQQFSYIISHNLRSPVARILGLVNILDGKYIQNTPNEIIINYLVSTTNTLDTVIKDLTQILAIRNSLDKTKEIVNLKEVTDLVKEHLQNEIQLTSTEIITNFSVVEEMFSVKSYVQSIIYNLLSNAIKYHSHKRTPQITVKTTISENYACFAVEDNGIGIDLEQTDSYKIFGLYQRMNTVTEGKGLGLYLVKTQIESLGGKIKVKSKLDVGSTFEVYFPL